MVRAGERLGVDVGFRETTKICIERPVGTGAAAEIPFDRYERVSGAIPTRPRSAATRSTVYRWLEGHTATIRHLADARQATVDLARFVAALQGIDAIRTGPG